MSIILLLPGETTPIECSTQEFGKLMGFEYVHQLVFAKEVKKFTPDIRQKWLGAYYGPEIDKAAIPPIIVQWIDTDMGYGVFARKDIPRGTFIGEYTGEVRRRRFFADKSNAYCFLYHSSYLVDARSKGNFTRFINHGAHPNLEPALAFHNGAFHIIFWTAYDIPAGTQLCYDYGETYWSKRKTDLRL